MSLNIILLSPFFLCKFIFEIDVIIHFLLLSPQRPLHTKRNPIMWMRSLKLYIGNSTSTTERLTFCFVYLNTTDSLLYALICLNRAILLSMHKEEKAALKGSYVAVQSKLTLFQYTINLFHTEINFYQHERNYMLLFVCALLPQAERGQFIARFIIVSLFEFTCGQTKSLHIMSVDYGLTR